MAFESFLVQQINSFEYGLEEEQRILYKRALTAALALFTFQAPLTTLKHQRKRSVCQRRRKQQCALAAKKVEVRASAVRLSSQIALNRDLQLKSLCLLSWGCLCLLPLLLPPLFSHSFASTSTSIGHKLQHTRIQLQHQHLFGSCLLAIVQWLSVVACCFEVAYTCYLCSFVYWHQCKHRT